VPAVEVNDLVVRYEDLVAVDHVSFRAQAGAVTAVLGPNGAGKTSTIEVCEGYRRAESGSATVLGLDPRRDRHQLNRRIGVMLQEGGVSLGARVGDVARQYCALYDKGVRPEALLDSVGLAGRAGSSYRHLSGGEKQRLSLALALAARPDVAFLDEPTSGVDVIGRQTIRGIVTDLAAQGCAVVLATHELDEAERIADHIVIFNLGCVIAEGTLDELRRGHDEIRFRSSPRLAYHELASDLRLSVRSVAGRDGNDDGEFVVEGDAGNVAALTAWLAARNEPLTDLRAGPQRLEDVFLRLTGGGA